jgi:hypothetical protein
MVLCHADLRAGCHRRLPPRLRVATGSCPETAAPSRQGEASATASQSAGRRDGLCMAPASSTLRRRGQHPGRPRAGLQLFNESLKLQRGVSDVLVQVLPALGQSPVQGRAVPILRPWDTCHHHRDPFLAEPCSIHRPGSHATGTRIRRTHARGVRRALLPVRRPAEKPGRGGTAAEYEGIRWHGRHHRVGILAAIQWVG